MNLVPSRLGWTKKNQQSKISHQAQVTRVNPNRDRRGRLLTKRTKICAPAARAMTMLGNVLVLPSGPAKTSWWGDKVLVCQSSALLWVGSGEVVRKTEHQNGVTVWLDVPSGWDKVVNFFVARMLEFGNIGAWAGFPCSCGKGFAPLNMSRSI